MSSKPRSTATGAAFVSLTNNDGVDDDANDEVSLTDDFVSFAFLLCNNALTAFFAARSAAAVEEAESLIVVEVVDDDDDDSDDDVAATTLAVTGVEIIADKSSLDTLILVDVVVCLLSLLIVVDDTDADELLASLGDDIARN